MKKLLLNRFVLFSLVLAISCSNVVAQSNPKYSQQYYLKNTGQNGGTVGIDINVEPAWDIITGSSNITIAVIGDGVDLYHEDLISCVLSGYTEGNPTGYGEPQNSSSQLIKGNGTACAGIIAAEDNSIGIKGVAHGVKILPVNIEPYGYSGNTVISITDEAAADAIRWAYMHADILLFCNTTNTYSQAISTAIQEARTQGRNGKGSIVLAAAGDNGYTTSVAFPGYYNGVIAVGAVDKNGQVCNYSNKGANLDLVAPSGNINLLGDVVTTDWMLNQGFTTNGDWNYTNVYGGTSAAAAMVAGVVGLMLSANSNLTEIEISDILKSTARKLPGYSYINGFCNDIGYGLVDAKSAVLHSLKLEGSTIPSPSISYHVNHLLANQYTVSWSWKHSCPVPITPDSPSVNQCTIANTSKEYIKDTLIATIMKNGEIVHTLEKRIYTGVNFSGTYAQAGGYVLAPYGGTTYYDPVPTTSFSDGARIILHTQHEVTLTSPLFSTSTVTCTSGSYPPSWSHTGNTITFRMPITNSPVSYQFTGRSSGYDVYKFIVFKPADLSGGGIVFSFSGDVISLSICQGEDGEPAETKAMEDPIWDITIVNIKTGKIKYQGKGKGFSQTISTAGWDPGIYSIQAVANNQRLTDKIMITK